MKAFRFLLAIVALVALIGLGALSATAGEPSVPPSVEVLRDWYKLALALVRHTPTYSPPVAARTFAYLGVTAFEATASGDDELLSLAGQLNGLKPTPQRAPGETYDEAMVLDAALAAVVGNLFSNTGPTGQRAMAALADKLHAEVSAALPADVAARSETYGRAVARAHPGLVARRRRGGGREHGLSARVHIDQGRGPLDADQPDRAAADAAASGLGQEPHPRHAERRGLSVAAAARIQRRQELRVL